METNSKLYNTIMEKLNFEPQLDASNITISIQGDDDIVLLGGSVGSFAEKLIAEKAVKGLPNIRTVANDIAVDLSMKYKKTDIEIAKNVTNALDSSIFIPSEDIKAVVKDGVVTLSGEVDWQFQKNRAFDAVKNIIGVKHVENNIKIKPTIKINTSLVSEKITKEFERHARLDASKINIKIDGRKIILSGKVRNFDEKDDAESAAWAIPGVDEVENNITISW